MKSLFFLVAVTFVAAVAYAGHSSRYYRTTERSTSVSSASNGDYAATETVVKTKATAACNGTYVPRKIVTISKTRTSAASSGSYGSVKRTRTVERPRAGSTGSYGSSGK